MENKQEISIVQSMDDLSEEEEKILFGWGEDIFDDHGTVFLPEKWHFKLYKDNCLSGHMGVTNHQRIKVNGMDIVVVGLTDVVTLPDLQGKGYGSQLMRQVLDFICHVLKPDFGMLLCWPALIPFYAKFGWYKVPGSIHYLQPAGRIWGSYTVMVYPCLGKSWGGGDIEINGLPW